MDREVIIDHKLREKLIFYEYRQEVGATHY